MKKYENVSLDSKGSLERLASNFGGSVEELEEQDRKLIDEFSQNDLHLTLNEWDLYYKEKDLLPEHKVAHLEGCGTCQELKIAFSPSTAKKRTVKLVDEVKSSVEEIPLFQSKWKSGVAVAAMPMMSVITALAVGSSFFLIKQNDELKNNGLYSSPVSYVSNNIVTRDIMEQEIASLSGQLQSVTAEAISAEVDEPMMLVNSAGIRIDLTHAQDRTNTNYLKVAREINKYAKKYQSEEKYKEAEAAFTIANYFIIKEMNYRLP